MSELLTDATRVLSEHDDPLGWMWSDSDQMVYACECGDHYVAGAIVVIQERDALAAAAWHRTHIAQTLMSLIERRVLREALLRGLGKPESAEMLWAMLRDASDRLSDPHHQGNFWAWPEHARMMRALADSIAPEVEESEGQESSSFGPRPTPPAATEEER